MDFLYNTTKGSKAMLTDLYNVATYKLKVQSMLEPLSRLQSIEC